MTIHDKITLVECALRIADMEKDIAKEVFIRLYNTEVECVNCPFSQKCIDEQVCDCKRFVENELFGEE